MNIYIGNLSYDTAEADVRMAFESHGEVTRVNIISDKDSGQSKGFGFVEMAEQQEGEAAIQALNESEMHGRTIKVSVAKPRPERDDRR